MIERHMDELDAAQAGNAWLLNDIKSDGLPYKLSIMSGTGGGGVVGLWNGHMLIAYYAILRDDMNWSVLVKHDLRNL